MTTWDGRLSPLALFRATLFVIAPSAVLALSLTTHSNVATPTLFVYVSLLILGVALANVEISLSNSIHIIPSDGVIIAALVMVPQQPWFSIGLIGICCSLKFARLKKQSRFVLLNAVFNMCSGSLAFVLVTELPHVNLGLRVLVLSIASVIGDVLVAIDIALEDRTSIRHELFQNLRYLFPDFIVAYAGGLTAYAYLTYGTVTTTIAFGAVVVAFAVIRDTIDLDNMYDVVIQAFLQAMKAKDEYTYRHSLRVAEECAEFARFLGWSPRDIRNAYWAGAMHDIGKLSVSIRLIRKRGKFTDEEYTEMKMHNIFVLAILGTVGFLSGLVEIAADKWAHYNFRRRGTGSEVAEMVAMLDAKDAMATTRSYHQPKTKAQVMGELFRCRRRQFNPYLVREYFRFVRESKRKFGLGFEDDRVDPGYEPPTTGFESAGLGHLLASDAAIKRRWRVSDEPVNPDRVDTDQKVDKQ
jgi:HD-GYP domain-containing protein (c-di-GMP phosphodiesterase class II)